MALGEPSRGRVRVYGLQRGCGSVPGEGPPPPGAHVAGASGHEPVQQWRVSLRRREAVSKHCLQRVDVCPYHM